MKKVRIARCDLEASEIALGCMRIASLSNQDIATLIHTALDEGINFFDHADVYAGGKSEEKFAEALNMTPRLRDRQGT
jgi:predicted oxidoreductase